MHDELTAVDIEKMREEIAKRKADTPRLIETMVHARELGDLSENEEYRYAKRELNRNYSRIRYLTKMISSAKVIDVKKTDSETVGLFDKVTTFCPEDGEEEEITIVTTLRNDVTKNLISKESPLGKALLGRKLGDTVTVRVSDSYSYEVKITGIEKGKDDENMEINRY